MEDLAAMFPSWDRASLQAVLTSANGDVGRAAEVLLGMAADDQQPQEQPQAATGDSASTVTSVLQRGGTDATAGGAVAGDPDGDGDVPDMPSIDMDAELARQLSREGDSQTLQQFQQPQGQQQQQGEDLLPVPPGQQCSQEREFAPGRRGILIMLPHDFLRPPGWQEKLTPQEMADEQLAVMLQNNMFQQEMQSTFSAEEIEWMRRRAAQRRRQQQQRRRQPGGADGDHADSGIMHTLQEMGSDMRSKLNDLAVRFRARTTGGGQGSNGQGSSGVDETRGLIAQQGSGDDEEEEVIDFGQPATQFNEGVSGRRKGE